jgi:general secretion pathway protein F
MKSSTTTPISAQTTRPSENPPSFAPSSIRIRVQTASGIQSLEFSGIGQSEVLQRVAARGMTVLSIDSIQAPELLGVRKGQQAPFPLLLFSQELLALLEAGLNLSEALATLLAKERQPGTRAVLQQVVQALNEGRSFSDVLALMPRQFPDVYIATVRASERTGDLPRALSRYIAYQMQFESLRKKLVSAAIYPAVLLGVGGLVTLFLLGYVVPRFSVVYESSGRELPWLSGLLLSFGRAVYSHWEFALAILVLTIWAAVWCVRRPAGRAWLVNQALRVPLLAAQAHQFRLARFYRAVSLLLTAGIALPRALEMVAGLLSLQQQRQLRLCRESIEQGRALSVAFVENQLVTPVAESLLKVGERSGQMAEMLERAAAFADDEFGRWIDWASKLLEPLLMTVLGVVIGTIVVLMYMPIFELAGSL